MTATKDVIATPADFPKPNGRSLVQLARGLGPGPILAPSVSDLRPGVNRFGFALFDRSRKQIAEAPTAVYVQSTKGGPVLGPFVAHDESLGVSSQFESQTVKNDPDAAHSVYVADVRFPRPGTYAVLGVARLDNRLVAAVPALPSLLVQKHDPVPGVGQRPPAVDTPTAKSAGGDLSKIDTRVPPDDMHAVSFKDVLGKKPIVLIFATPLLCQSRVCGPVVDIAQEIEHTMPAAKQFAFIHNEIYNNNMVADGYRPQVAAFRLPTEPWAFVVDRRGKIAARMEGAFSAAELESAMKVALRR